ncbi:MULTISPECIES: ATP synthase F0 subunit B [Desulfosediminicola]|uniref:F0F1 ATP synthase subunit B family protein n=1 Tax=Desulfosediminicola TaxID=2886823 RepID=UPI0010ACE88B|nr:ATP synthase F0 subunit B [Desulfosediminicola ganghwensis]
MRGVKEAVRLTILAIMTLCFTLSSAPVWASSSDQASHSTTDQATHAAPADAHGEAAGGHSAAAGGSLSAEKIKDLGFRIMNFAVLVFLLVKFAAKPIGNGLSARRKQIRDEIEELEAKKATAEKSYQEFTTKLAGVEKEIDTVVDKAIAQAKVEKAKIIEKAELAAADIKRQAEMAIQKEVMEAKRTLKDDVAEQAAVMAEELIVKNLTADDQVKIVEDYLAKVGAVQ